MTWDINTGLTKVPAPPAGQPPQTALVQSVMDMSLSLAELYCDRGFLRQQETVKFYDIEQRFIQLPRWPVLSIDATSQNLGKYHLHRAAGQIKFHGERFFDEIDITYIGGYFPLPAELEMALWDIFAVLWSQHGDTGGGVQLPTVQLGAVKKKTIVGVGSIEYETGSSSGSTGSVGAADLSDVLPGATQAILDLYRRQSV